MTTNAPDRGLVISVGDSRKSTDWKTKQISWDALKTRLRTVQRTSETVEQFASMPSDKRSDVKDVGGFIGGAVRNGSRKADDVDFRSLLTLDVDFASDTFWDDYCMMNEYTACMYSTHSHREGHNRLRIVIPMTHNVEPLQYEAIARMVARDIGIDMFDDTTYEPNRLMYWPSCPIDGEFIFEETDGDWLDPDEVLGRYHDWRDESSWPHSSHSDARMRKHAKEQGDPCEKPGFVGAFCRVYDIPAAIEKFLPDVYGYAAEDRYTFLGGTTYGGVKLFDDGAFMFSWHSTDPLHGRLLNAFDLVRLHLFREQDGDQEDKVTMSELPSYRAMVALCAEDADVVAEYKAHMGEDDADPAMKSYDGMYTDQDVARIVSKRYAGKLLYHPSLDWLWYDGTHWIAGSDSEAVKAIMRINNELLEDARLNVAMATSKEERSQASAILGKVTGLRSAGRIGGIKRLMQAELLLPDITALDKDAWYLNTPDYVIDLRTGEHIVHDPKLMCSHVTRVTPEHGSAPMWEKFLSEATQGDREMADYLQIVAGAACVGQVYDEGLLMVYGPGGNGKSTLFGTLTEVLGDYATTLRSDILIQKANGAEPYGLEEVRGRRMVIMGETDEGARLSVSVMKRLTSRDNIQANPKHKQPFEFTPTHKLILHTNHLPRLGQLDNGTRRRIAVVPFEAPAKSPSEIIPDLDRRLVEQEGAQVLMWMVEGARKFFERGCFIQKPKSVLDKTEEYIGGEDWLKLFLDEQCVVGKGMEVGGGELYSAYRMWAERNKDFVRRNRDFTNELEMRGYTKRKTMHGAKWYGIGLAEEVV